MGPEATARMEQTRRKSTYCEPTVLWRLRSATDSARATVVPHWHYATVLWWVNERLDGAVDCASVHDALLEGNRVRDAFLKRGWWTDDETVP